MISDILKPHPNATAERGESCWELSPLWGVDQQSITPLPSELNRWTRERGTETHLPTWHPEAVLKDAIYSIDTSYPGLSDRTPTFWLLSLTICNCNV